MEIYKLLGNTFLSFSDDSITQNIEIGVLREVQNG